MFTMTGKHDLHLGEGETPWKANGMGGYETALSDDNDLSSLIASSNL